MSRIGKKPIKIEDSVTVTVENKRVVVKGPLGELSRELPRTVSVEVANGEVVVNPLKSYKQARADHGTTRALVANMIEGVTKGYKKELEVVGLGYRVELQGNKLVLSLGWNHPVIFEPPEGIQFSSADNTHFEVSGIDKDLVGLWAAKIRSLRKPEPYKGKGIRYIDEYVRRKTSKSMGEE